MKTTPDWYGKQSPYQPAFELAIDDGSLLFTYRATKQAHYDDLPLGAFQEGLWEKDVAEFFVGRAGSTEYQEINVSPTGAWWSALFSDYRVLKDEVRFVPQIEIERGADTWEVSFKVKIQDLIPWRETDERLFSAASILYDPEPNYFCWNHPPGDDEPDFHRLDLLKALQL